MLCHLLKNRTITANRKIYYWYQNCTLLLLLSITGTLCGCFNATSKQIYSNTEFGIRVEQPDNWELSFNERNGSIILAAKDGVWNPDFARIEIYGYACVPSLFDNTQDELQEDIDRIKTLYNLEAIEFKQKPLMVNDEDVEITSAVVAIPTLSMPENSVRNQARRQAKDLFQIIEIFAMRNGNGNSIMVYLYPGNSNKLNTEATTIVNSIELICR